MMHSFSRASRCTFFDTIQSFYWQLQSTQHGFCVFHFTTADKVYLERTIAGYSKRTVAVIVYWVFQRDRQQSRWSGMTKYRIKGTLFPSNFSLNIEVCLIHDAEIYTGRFQA